METNSKRVLEAMPSFDDFIGLAEEIKLLSIKKMKLENLIKGMESETFIKIMTDPQYFVNNKAVAVSYFDNAYKFAGLAGAILPFRNDLADTIAELETKRNQFEIYKQMHDLFKTLVYQEKNMG